MFIEKFETNYNGDYQAISDNESKIHIVKNGFEVVYSIMEEPHNIVISKDFVYEDDDSHFSAYYTNRKQLLFIQLISKMMGINSFVENDVDMCLFTTETVGYRIEKNDLSTLEKAITAFESALNSDNQVLDAQFLEENFSDEYEHFCHMKSEIFSVLEYVCNDSKYCTFTQISKAQIKRNIFAEDDPIFSDSRGTIIVGATEEMLIKIGTIISLPIKDIECSYNGFIYYFGKSQGKSVAVDIRLINEAKRIIDQAFLDSVNIVYKMDNGKRPILIQSEGTWVLIAPIRADIDIKALEEREAIRQMSLSLNAFLPTDKAKEVYLFESLDDTLFEKLCKDLLVEIGFKNVVIRGATNAADGGVDIEADEEMSTLFGTTIRHWIFQCKHTKAQFGRKDAAEIPCLLREFKADCYGIFYSRIFTPQALDRLKSLDRSVKYWGKNELDTLLDKHRKVAVKYFGI